MGSILLRKQKGSRRKRSRIALVGYRATGKTTVGRRLARAFGWRFCDMDSEITKKTGNTIADIVQDHGWEYFRNLETLYLKMIKEEEKLVLATGGGIVIREENRNILKEHFFVVWLTASSSAIRERLGKDPHTDNFRPSLTGKNVMDETEEVLEERTPLYKEVADFIVDTRTMSADKIVKQIHKSWEEMS